MIAFVVVALLLALDLAAGYLERQHWAAERARLTAAALAPTPQQAQSALIAADAKRSDPLEPRYFPPAVGEDG